VAAVIVSAVGYFFSLIAIFTTIMAFMTLLIGGFDPLTLEKVHHYPHPRPTIERTDTPTNSEPHHARVAPGTDEATPATALSAQTKSTEDSHAASVAKKDAENRRSERKIKPERRAHLHQPKVLARQRQNYEGYGSGMALGYAEGYHPGLDAQR
jgi:hypothetical protein